MYRILHWMLRITTSSFLLFFRLFLLCLTSSPSTLPSYCKRRPETGLECFDERRNATAALPEDCLVPMVRSWRGSSKNSSSLSSMILIASSNTPMMRSLSPRRSCALVMIISGRRNSAQLWIPPPSLRVLSLRAVAAAGFFLVDALAVKRGSMLIVVKRGWSLLCSEIRRAEERKRSEGAARTPSFLRSRLRWVSSSPACPCAKPLPSNGSKSPP